jgi:hypothetical protein
MTVELGRPPHGFIFPSVISFIHLTGLRTDVTSGHITVRPSLILFLLYPSPKHPACPWAHKTSYTVGTEAVFLGLKSRSVKPISHVSLRVKDNWSYTSISEYAFLVFVCYLTTRTTSKIIVSVVNELMCVWSIGGMILTGKIKVLGEKPASVLLNPPQIPNALAFVRTLAPA